MERREVDCFKCNECNNIEFCITIHLVCKSDVWLTVHRNSVWIRKTN